jgi:hypothetical protein
MRTSFLTLAVLFAATAQARADVPAWDPVESTTNAYVATAAAMFVVALGLAGLWLARGWVRNGREGAAPPNDGPSMLP